MKNTLIFLLALCVCQSDTQHIPEKKLEKTFDCIIKGLSQLKEKSLITKPTSQSNTSLEEILEDLNKGLKNNTDISQNKQTLQKNVETMLKDFQEGKIQLECPKCEMRKHSDLIKKLKCFNRSCHFSFTKT